MNYLLNQVTCETPQIKNQTKVWSLHDKEVLAHAQNQCRVIYGDNYCVRIIVKVEENAYKIICYNAKEKE